MSFALFGKLWADLAFADKTVHSWWPDTSGKVSAVELEWTPGKSRKGEYLENRSAFDVAFILDLGTGMTGMVGVESKYHEHAVPMKKASEDRMNRYRKVAEESGAFGAGAIEQIVGADLQQIWLDHLLADLTPRSCFTRLPRITRTHSGAVWMEPPTRVEVSCPANAPVCRTMLCVWMYSIS